MVQKTRDIKLTYEDYLLFPDDGKRHELIDGEHYMTPAPSTKHQTIVVNLTLLLGNFIRQNRLGKLFSSPVDVLFSDTDIVQPDIIFIATTRGTIIKDKNIQGAPDLVIEILSETTRKTDETTKRKLYERYGVAEYWIVDPELETVKIYRMTDRAYIRTAELSRETGDILNTSLLPELHLPLVDIFEYVL